MSVHPTPTNSRSIMVLILFTESLDVRFAVRIKEFLAALLPCRFEFGRCDVTVHPTFPGHGTQVLAEIFHSGPAEEPVARCRSYRAHGQSRGALPRRTGLPTLPTDRKALRRRFGL